MLVCAGRAVQRRAQLRADTWNSSGEEDGVPHGAIARPRSRFDPRVVRSRNCANARKAQRAALRRRSERARDEERRRRTEEWERTLMLARASRVVARHNAEAGALRLVSTYHKMLQHGYLAIDIGRPRTLEIHDFMLSAMAGDIITPEFIGLTTFMQQWDLMSRFHSEVDFRAERLQLFPMDGAAKTYPSLAERDRDEAVYVVKSTGTTTLRISRLTVENIFPHILNDEQLVQLLIGKTYRFNFTVFSHVRADGVIFQMESRVDLSSALMTLLHDREAAASIIRKAAFMPSGNLSLQDEVRESQNTLANSYL
ncbi:hypothetical protein PR003_g20080 [Phytophthora rubi]|uniref:Uncharacterized protein n=1 Tax=Phytophthora rubi TaxID=129364 RepID=A0A6A3JW08_9STRA|nr:hypothetical protein PR002_g19332 [Phytophthora rubi]KAE8999842.1 hypothetical protein PR001_g18948 [Phytophthora rubi]KAE9311169.1 hypothetical protein PR003_g20080 [Phytophthora rubi]